MADEILELPPNYRPSEDEPYMNPKQIEYFRRKLILWREDLLGESKQTLGRLREANLRQPDPVDGGSIEGNLDLEFSSSEHYREILNRIDEALERINNGTYGYCDETGEEIGIKRLEANPIATLSIEAQRKRERLQKVLKVRP